MGAKGSKTEDPEEGQESTAPAEHPDAAKLYCMKDDKWTLQLATVLPRFTQEEEGDKDIWYMDIDETEEKVSEALRMVMDPEKRSFLFYAPRVSTVCCLKFYTAEGFAKASEQWNTAIMENTYGSEKEQKAILGDNIAWIEGTDSEDVVWELEEPTPPTPSKFRDSNVCHSTGKAQQLAIGGRDNSFLLREDSIDVFRNAENGINDANFSIKLNPVDAASSYHTPTKAILSNCERNMLLLTPDRSSVQRLDLEYQKVVTEFKLLNNGVELSVADITPDCKSAQMEDRATFMGMNPNNLMRFDCRDRNGVVQESPHADASYLTGHAFSGKPNFRCMATTGDGHVVIGAADGRIRLYKDSTLSRAKTSFPGLGSPITAIDCTFDGKWIVATTENYLLVICTVFKNKKGIHANGFTDQMGNSMPAPRMLKISANDIMKTGGAPFEKAQFTWITEAGKQERWITACCGNYNILWNFRYVKTVMRPGGNCPKDHRGMMVCTDYQIEPKQAKVIGSSFMHDNFTTNANALVVATEHDVFNVNEEMDED
mmetsp:Transcript_1909/g.2120  ORF Transcript_1909/g.2120 Transcript_1909/m.2120 type:complete len:542 (-) Transcript_1909:988-2613(-)|eukprot:CAMPEP_0197849334 /NCGR_PEP_ID=MMETSP1438-20131217/11675_1 /TAXON_ID=1461541 /ORGANISM="Pterosperma sp., Strain CCMP1384" /LENGTH=541 /DNA_ID=CAMNT_0043461965 /DNA_START=102 /DNA_END=1727 /DNA_ORIENTATION=+